MSVRFARLSLALLIAAPFAAAPLSAQSVEYAAGTTKYRISTMTKGSQWSPMATPAKLLWSLEFDLQTLCSLVTPRCL